MVKNNMDNQFEELLSKMDEVSMFVEDKIEFLEKKIKELDTLAKGCRKGSEQSHIYRQIDALEAEFTKARSAAEEE